MGLVHTFRSLERSISRPSRELTRAQERRAALVAYESPAAILESLRRSQPAGAGARIHIVAALVAEYRASADPLWQTLLLLAFEPMLCGLRKRLGKMRDEDLDQRIVVAFIAALKRLPEPLDPLVVPIALRRAVAHEVFGEVREERALPRCEEIGESKALEPFVIAPDTIAADTARVLERSAMSDEMIAVLLATHAGDEALIDYVERTHASLDPRARKAVYGRLRRERGRALERLRVTASLEQAA